MRVVINVEEVQEIVRKRIDFNKLCLEDIEFRHKGRKVNIRKEEIDNFVYTGLSNIDFVTGRNWEERVGKVNEVEAWVK